MKIRLKIKVGDYQKSFENYDIQEDETIATVIDRFELNSTGSIMISVNGRLKGRNYKLKDKDEVLIFSALLGG